jgi:cell division protein FtsL
MSEEVKDLRSQFRSVNMLAYLTVAIVAITLAVGLGTYFWAVVNWNKSVNEGIVRVEEQIKAGQAERADLQGKVQTLERRLNEKAMPKKSYAAPSASGAIGQPGKQEP